MKLVNLICGLVFGLVAFVITTQPVAAQTFYVSTQPAANQRNLNVSYFDLTVQPKQTQTLSVMVVNPDPKAAVTVELAVDAARTNDNGVIEYGPDPKLLVDKSLKYPLSKLLKIDGPKQITLAPNTSQQVNYTLKSPSGAFDGVIAGGVSFTQVLGDEQQLNQGVKCKSAYTIGVVLQQAAKPIVQPKVLLSNVKVAEVDQNQVILAQLQNPNPAFIRDAEIVATLTGKQTKLEMKKINYRIAPNSHFNLPLTLAPNEKIKPGKYTYTADIKAKEGHWRVTKDVYISSSQAKQHNVKHAPKPKAMDISIWILAALLLGNILWFFFSRKKRQQKKESV
ncbi:MAG: DUF916 and DUF3324 domain-containing protein [Lactobacillaceae bacterium]|jgi:hypothetical protein|nr:DUF916 and DUF3324 domain-containing protein [Lactobacillaceae bacterium]